MIIGNFTYDPTTDTYAGELWTLFCRHAYMLISPNTKARDGSPDYRIIQNDPSGSAVIGAAWRRQSDAGKPFLSVTLDDPSLPVPINAALFRDDGSDQARLVWSRRPSPAPDAVRQPAPTKRKRAHRAPPAP